MKASSLSTLGHIRTLPRLRFARWPAFFGWAALILAGLIAADLVFLHLRPSDLYRLDVGFWGDQDLLSGTYGQEVDVAGTTYRWTRASGSFVVRGFAAVPHPILEVAVGGLPRTAAAPRPFHLLLDGQPLAVPVAASARRYHLLLPSAALLDGNLDVDFASDTSRMPPDRRDVGVRLDEIALGWSLDPWVLPAWPALLIQWAAVLVWLGVAWRLEIPRRAWLGIVVALVLLIGWMAVFDLLTASAWEARVLFGGVILLGLAWHAFSLLAHLSPGLGSRREVRWLCVITALAIGIRLVGIFYPPFGTHDLYIHQDRLQQVQAGSLALYDTPSEFASQRTIVPPAFYLLVNPFTLLTVSPGPAIQGLFAFLDGTSPLLIAMFVRELRGSPRAALLSAIAIAVLPIQMTALWWGFGPQVVGQWLLLILAVFAARRPPANRNFWIVASLLLCCAFVIHNGVVILGGLWLAGYILLVWWFHRPARSYWLGWGLTLIAASALAVALVYVDVVVLQIHGLAGGATAPQRFDNLFRITLIWQGLYSSLRPLGYALGLASCVMLVVHTRGIHRLLVVAWLASAALFLAVDVALGLQVRYAYFAVPMLCAGLGLLLDRLMSRHRAAWLAGWCLIALIAWTGLSLWVSGAIFFVKPTLTALTH